MLYLVTGANGAGKTLLTLKHVREMADKEARPVCYNGRFDLNEDGPLRAWRKIDIKDWQAEPDGTIFFVDECHNDFPIRPASMAVPEYVRMLAEHRKRGFDFFLITQHPQNIDAFVRRLIGNPGWHRHLKRIAGAGIVSQLQWDAVNPQCERPGSGDSGQVTTVPFPKEVYTWYRSAQLHTAKRKIPRAVYVLVGAAVLVPALTWTALHQVRKNVIGQAPQAARVASGAVSDAGPGSKPEHVLTPAEYVAARMPRVAGLPFSAAAYDKVTQPSVAPYPAACVLHQESGKCDCYTQQATRLDTPKDVCTQVARSGIFIDWHQEVASVGVRELVPGGAVVPARGAVLQPAPAAPVAALASAGVASGAVSAADTRPVFFPAVTASGGLVGEPTVEQTRDAAVQLSMRDGQWSKR